jgi:ABC-type lipoprotein release transport system permease subunit
MTGKIGTLWGLKRIALRNLTRHKVKTLLTCAAIMVSVAAYIWADCWIGGMGVESRRNIINYEMGAAKLQTRLYFDNKDELPAYENFAGWETYAEALDAAGYNTAPRYVFSGTVYSHSGAAPLVVNAVDPAAEARMLEYPRYIDFGRYIRPGEFALAFGAMTADKLKIGIPPRPTAAELDELVALASDTQRVFPSGSYFGMGDVASRAVPDTLRVSGTEAFIRSCYQPMEVKTKAYQTKESVAEQAKDRMALRRDLPAADMERLWALVDATGRNDVRISAVIDYKLEGDKVAHVYQVIDAKVVGVVNSPNPATNYNIAYIPLDVLQDEAGMMLEGHITELLIRDKTLGAADMTSKKERAPAIRAALETGLAARGLALPDGLDVFSWPDYVSDYFSAEASDSGSMKALTIMLFVLSFIGISNTILLSILERGKEIGMMRAMGMTDGEMVVTYMLEAAAIGLAGSLLGIIVGCALNYPMVKYGIDYSGVMEQVGGNIGYRITGVFRSIWKFPTIIGSGIIATLLSGLMAYFPTRRAMKAAITENLRFE